ncbi:MAG: 4Fe-4S binding protein [Clostridiales bacterium]|nr:4Fe-4S binding protein [Clostridiales bacterium]
MNMRVRYAGLELAHPIIAASAGTTMDYREAVKCEDAGFSAVVLKSVQEEVLMRYNPFPRFKVLRSGMPGYESCTFYSYEQAYYGGIEEYAETVLKSKERTSIPIIASINCIAPETWAEYAVACEDAGADAIEIVPSCPSGLLMRDPSNDGHAIAVGALRDCKAAVKIPVIPKMSGQVANVIHTAVALDRAGADGLTMVNRATGIEIDIDQMRPILHGGFAGHGGSWALNSVLRWIISTAPNVRAVISATGGIMTGEDVVKCLLAGAETAQIAAAVYLKGYEYVQVMLGQIEKYMERHALENLSDIVGVAGKNMLTIEQYDRATRYVSECNQAKCTGCRKCEKVCIYDAISLETGKCEIDPERCDGCGLCPSVCRFGAIQIHPKEV